MKIFFIAISLFCFATSFLSAQSMPASKQTKSILLWGANIHTGRGDVLYNGAIGFKEGKITFLMSGEDLKRVKLDKQQYDTIINVENKEIYPAFIAPNSTLGLNEVDAVRATHDFSETGVFNPHVRSIIAYNTDSKITGTVKSNGVLYAQITPRDGRISGKSSIVNLDSWNWEDAILKVDDGIHLNFPSMIQHFGWWAEPASNPNESNLFYDDQFAEMSSFFKEAAAYIKQKGSGEMNLRLEAMRGVFEGKTNLFIHVDYVKDILAAVQFATAFEFPKVVLVGAKDAWKVTGVLKQKDISVMVNRIHDLPNLEQEDIDQAYKLPYLLQRDSVLYCIQNHGDMEVMNTRNLPFLAGTATAYGLTKEQALMAITYNTAKILGVDHEIGSLEQGKRASLIISSGDALDMKTNNIEKAFIDGRSIDLNNHQKVLYEKYKKKYQLND